MPQAETILAPSPAIDLALARRLAQRCESSAAAAQSWAIIVMGRLHNGKPMTDAAKDVAGRICDEMVSSADDLRQSADSLRRLLGTVL
jgi:hypothetical protein